MLPVMFRNGWFPTLFEDFLNTDLMPRANAFEVTKCHSFVDNLSKLCRLSAYSSQSAFPWLHSFLLMNNDGNWHFQGFIIYFLNIVFFLYPYANMPYFADIFAQFIYLLHEMIILFHEMISVKAHFVPNFAVVKHQRYAQCRIPKFCYGICHVVSGASTPDGEYYG